MGLFRHQPRSASVRADTATVLLKLSAAQLETFEAHDPSLAAALYRLFVQQMASRVEQLTVQAHQLSR
jgi:CRP-like cAMP-binding protein